jgi:uncharacterized protein DUF4826
LERSEEEAWLNTRRSDVADYLKSEGVAHGQIGEYPAWHLWPHVSIWAIESVKSPGWVGWWVVCGDHPTDYVSSTDIKDPRSAMRAIGRRWNEVSAFMLRGETHPSITIGTPELMARTREVASVACRDASRVAADDDVWVETAP